MRVQPNPKKQFLCSVLGGSTPVADSAARAYVASIASAGSAPAPVRTDKVLPKLLDVTQHSVALLPV